MTKKDKIIKRFQSRLKDFEWKELVILLTLFGYEVNEGGKTSGSKCQFTHRLLPKIRLHKPHPSPVLKSYQIEQVLKILKEEGLL